MFLDTLDVEKDWLVFNQMIEQLFLAALTTWLLRFNILMPDVVEISRRCLKPKLKDVEFRYPLVNRQKAIENGHRNSGFTHKKWWLSIVFCKRLPEATIYWQIIPTSPRSWTLWMPSLCLDFCQDELVDVGGSPAKSYRTSGSFREQSEFMRNTNFASQNCEIHWFYHL